MTQPQLCGRRARFSAVITDVDDVQIPVREINGRWLLTKVPEGPVLT